MKMLLHIAFAIALLAQFSMAPLAAAQVVQPIERVNYDPLGLVDNNHQAVVYCNTAVAPTLPYRPWRIIAIGSGWVSGSGQPPQSLDLAASPTYAHWYEQGDVLIFMGYTVLDASPTRGAFHPTYWSGQGRDLVIDEEQLDKRHSELDLVNLVQHLRYYGLVSVPDLDRRPGRGGILGRSAGSVTAWWVGGPLERANPNALDPRFRVSTRVGWTIHVQTIASFAALKDSVVQNHLAAPSGALPTAIGSVPNALLSAASPLRWAREGDKPPCFCSGDGTVVGVGPWSWSAFQGVLGGGQIHASDHVLAIASMPGHHPHSRFVTSFDPATIEAERFEWVDQIEIRLQ